MSDHRRPSPIQPPFVISAQNTMAQVQRPPTFPTSNFLGRPQQRAYSGAGLPPIQAIGQPQQNEDHTLPPIQLPPLQPPPTAETSTRQVFSKSIPINHLLSHSPSQPPRPHPAPQHPMHKPMPVGHGGLPYDSHVRPTYVQPAPHHLNQAPHPAYRNPAPVPSEIRYRVPAGHEPDYAQYSPAVTTSSASRSYYGSEESSPRASLAPGNFSATANRISQPPPLNYNLSIRQQPAAARACGFGERDRRVIDPPPILELKITDREGQPEQDHNGMLALHCTLLNDECESDETEVPPASASQPATRRLMGTLVASPYQAKDERGIAGTFFVFPDLSCRSPGKYRLRFKLLRIDPAHMQPGMSSPNVASITTDVFSVFTAKDFPGMRASSALLKSLRRQGLNVGVKKGSEARKSKVRSSKKEGSDSEEDSGSEDSDADLLRGSGGTAGSSSTNGVSPRTQPKKKAKTKRKRRDS